MLDWKELLKWREFRFQSSLAGTKHRTGYGSDNGFSCTKLSWSCLLTPWYMKLYDKQCKKRSWQLRQLNQFCIITFITISSVCLFMDGEGHIVEIIHCVSFLCRWHLWQMFSIHVSRLSPWRYVWAFLCHFHVFI